MAARNGKYRTRLRKISLRDGWWAVGAVVAIGLFFWSTWQTQKLDQLYRDRVKLERELEFARFQYREAQAQWYEQTQPERILRRAAKELALEAERGESRVLVALPGQASARESASEWLTKVAQRLDRFGEITDATAQEELP